MSSQTKATITANKMNQGKPNKGMEKRSDKHSNVPTTKEGSKKDVVSVENMLWTDFDDHKGLYSGSIDKRTCLPHGYGTFICDSDTERIVCKCQFDQGKANGYGTFFRHNKLTGKKSCYDGQWKNDRAHGMAKHEYEDGTVHEGEWKANKRSGYGVFKFASGAKYEGQWRDDTFSQGVLYYQGGGRYEGQWRGYKRHGRGEITYVDGSSYCGQWRNDIRSGRGTCKYADGSEYEGQWRDDDRNGQGVYRFFNGNEYNGYWKNGDMNGRGTYKFTDGSQYDGEWKDGKKHGRGTYKYADGSIYDGHWQNDNKHGEGEMTLASGERQVGRWDIRAPEFPTIRGVFRLGSCRIHPTSSSSSDWFFLCARCFISCFHSGDKVGLIKEKIQERTKTHEQRACRIFPTAISKMTSAHFPSLCPLPCACPL